MVLSSCVAPLREFTRFIWWMQTQCHKESSHVQSFMLPCQIVFNMLLVSLASTNTSSSPLSNWFMIDSYNRKIAQLVMLTKPDDNHQLICNCKTDTMPKSTIQAMTRRSDWLFGRVCQLIFATTVVAFLNAGIKPQWPNSIDVLTLECRYRLIIDLLHQLAVFLSQSTPHQQVDACQRYTTINPFSPTHFLTVAKMSLYQSVERHTGLTHPF